VRTVALVGSTGSIGTQAVDVIAADPDRYKVLALGAASSIDLLNKAFLKVVEAGFQFVHADVTVIMEKPKLAPHIDAMEERLAEALLAGPAHVSVKAKTNEGMGWIGRGEGVAVFAVATLRGERVS